MFIKNIGVVLDYVNPIAGSFNHFKSFPGSIIQGEAYITVRGETIRVKCIDFLLKGSIDIKLSESLSTNAKIINHSEVTCNVSLSEQLVNPTRFYRIDGPIVLEPGVHRYPLKLDISSLPVPSYRDIKYRIQYQVETVLRSEDISGRYDQRFNSQVIVHKLNQMQPFERVDLYFTQEPVSIAERSVIGCFASDIWMKVTLQKTAFEPGEKLRIQLEFSTKNSTKTLKPEVKLKYSRRCQLSGMPLVVSRSYQGIQTIAKIGGIDKIQAVEKNGERFIDCMIPVRCNPVGLSINYLGTTLEVNCFIAVKLVKGAEVKIPVRIGYNTIPYKSLE